MSRDQVKSSLPASEEPNAAPQDPTPRNRKSVQEVSKQKGLDSKSKWPKTDVRHWRGRLHRNSFTRDGVRQETSDWCVKIAHLGRRETFNLGTPNAEAAASRALKIYRTLVGAGWEITLAEHKPETVKKVAAPTVGALISAATRLSSARPESLTTYTKALRRIVAGVLKLDTGRKYDFKRGSAEWREKVDQAGLDTVTPSAVLAWKNSFLKAAQNPQERSAAAVTVNSLIRNSKALLSKKIRPFIEKEITLPSPLWFEGIPLEKEGSLRYHSQIDATSILRDAMHELASEEPEPFKALLLTLVCGLRRSEADTVEWSQFNFEAGTLEIRDTEHKALKSADSAGVIALDPEVVVLLKNLKDKADGIFVLETPGNFRKEFSQHTSRTYRCDATHNRLIEWLKAKGVKGKRPLHTMRKEIGSIIATREGIFAASRFLRHSDIRITSRLYADGKKLVSAGISSFLFDPG